MLHRVELLAEGRMAEVFAYGDGAVVKLDRPEWSGVSAFESEVLVRLAEAGLPVARSRGVVTIDGRCGVVLDRIEGGDLLTRLMAASAEDLEGCARRFTQLQRAINATHLDGLPDLVTRLHDEVDRSGLPEPRRQELDRLLTDLDDGGRGVCHFDFHPLNVLVNAEEWTVIDWLTVASGPALADLARTLVLWGQRTDQPVLTFLRSVRRIGLAALGADDASCDAWVRVIAGARLAEGFDEGPSRWLRRVAAGETRLFN
jgi:Ser/Thr protein kinase RdoA (MazF antagonist)